MTSAHFIGIGGVGMSPLAELMHRRGHVVSGTDLKEGANTRHLRSLGIDVKIGHEAGHLGKADVVVRSSAIRDDNPEVERARALGLPVVGRGELLADLLGGSEAIVVAGTHGKTTTSSMIAHVLAETGQDPTAIIGGRIGGGESGLRYGRDDLFVCECDESDGSFLHLRPTVAVLTNVDPEHLDHYGTVEALENAFVQFTAGMPLDGVCVACADHPRLASLLPRIERRRVTYGLDRPADLEAHDVRADGLGMRFAVRTRGREMGEAFVPMPGRHNVANALAALTVARERDVPWRMATDALATYAGVDRRFSLRGEAAGIQVVDDYAHHPAELVATLAAARGVHAGRIVAVFQPHRYTRTRDAFDGFVAAFDAADLLVVTDVYAAGDPPIDGVSGQALAAAIERRGSVAVQALPTLDAALEWLPDQLAEGDLVLTLGAGDVSSLGPRLLEALSAANGEGGSA
jgi:UDP-N-acetylmuramate--alanine ligase